MSDKIEVKNIKEAKERLEKIIKKEKLNNTPILNNINYKPKKT